MKLRPVHLGVCPLLKEASMAAGVLAMTAVNVSLSWIMLLQSGLLALDVWSVAPKWGIFIHCHLRLSLTSLLHWITCFLW